MIDDDECGNGVEACRVCGGIEPNADGVCVSCAAPSAKEVTDGR